MVKDQKENGNSNKEVHKIENVRRRQNIKSKRKKGLLKKCYELATLCDLKICIVIYDERSNCLQQYASAEDFKIDNIRKLIHEKQHLLIRSNPDDMHVVKKKPRQNFMEDLPIDLHLRKDK